MQINNRRRLHTRIEFHNRNPNFKLFHKRIETCKRKRWSQDAKIQLDKIYPFFYHCNNSNEQRCGALSLYRQSAFCFILICFVLWSKEAFARWDAQLTRRYFFVWVLACTQLAGNCFLVALVDCEEFCEKISLRTFSMTSFKIRFLRFFFLSWLLLLYPQNYYPNPQNNRWLIFRLTNSSTCGTRRQKERKIPCQMAIVCSLLGWSTTSSATPRTSITSLRASPAVLSMWSSTVKMDEEILTYWLWKMVLAQHNCVRYRGW